MREVICAACQAKASMNEAFSAAERSLCGNCLEQFLAAQTESGDTTDGITRLIDPTICIHCAADGGNDEWSTVAGLPACATCETFFRNRPYPGWLKASFAIFLCVAVAAFAYNWRFFMAYVEIIEGRHAMEDGNIPQAIGLFASAANRLPEIPELAVLPNLYDAQQLVAENKYQEALALLAKSRPHAPPDMLDVFRLVELQARSGMAFDQRDYDLFLQLSQQSAELVPHEAWAAGSIASAYACKYAASGDPAFREQALQHLEKAKALAGPDDDALQDYENRILHRLHTREVITREQFYERFPNGWKSEVGA